MTLHAEHAELNVNLGLAENLLLVGKFLLE